MSDTPKKYRKKPVVIEAMQYGPYRVPSVAMHMFLDNSGAMFDGKGIIITTLEGNMRAEIGDYIIKGIKGEFYPCKPDIFEATYEMVNE